MQKFARLAIGLFAFVASYAILTFLVAPLLTQKGGYAPLDEAAMARFPVAIVIRRESAAANPSYAVAQMRHVPSVTTKAASFSFLLPAGNNTIVDQDGDPASYTADDISPGRQRVRLRAKVGDYTRDVEYEAEEKKVFPLQESHTGPQLGIYTIPVSVLFAWIVLWVTKRRDAKK